MQTTVKVEFIGDYICPWCYIGKVRLERVQEAIAPDITLDIEMKPYLLYPNMPEEGIHKSNFKKSKPGMGRALKQESQIENIQLNYNLIDRIPNSLQAHRLVWLANDPKIQYKLAKKIFQAYFEEGKNIADLNILANIARTINDQSEWMDHFLNTSDGMEEVMAYLEQSKEKFITVVPHLILNDRFDIPGLQSVEVWEQYISRAAELSEN